MTLELSKLEQFIEKIKVAHHEHDGWQEHPVAVKGHSEYFSIQPKPSKIKQQDRGSLTNPSEYEVKRRYVLLNEKISRSSIRTSENQKILDAAARFVPADHLHRIGGIKFIDKDYLSRQNVGKSFTPPVGLCVGGGKITLSSKATAATLIHEIGHAVHSNLRSPYLPLELRLKIHNAYKRARENNAGFVTDFAKINVNEFFAESYTIYVVAAKELEKRNSEIKSVLDEISKFYRGIDNKHLVFEGQNEKGKELQKQEADENDNKIFFADPECVGEFNSTLPDLVVGQQDKSNLNQLEKWLEKQLTSGAIEAKRRGLVPQSADWNAPDRWILPPEKEDSKKFNEISRLLEDYKPYHDNVQKRLANLFSSKNTEIQGRLKSVESVLEKEKRKGKPYTNMLDISGSRVVFNTLDDVESGKNMIRDNFNVVEETDHLNNARSYYRAYHFIIKDDNHYAEIQLHSRETAHLAQWGHNLVYKPKSVIPLEVMNSIIDYANNMSSYYMGKHEFVPCPEDVKKYVGCLEE